MRWFLAAWLALGALACGSSGSKRCEQICRREADCAERVYDDDDDERKVDRAECVDLCTELDRSSEGAAIVTAHEKCVMNAPDCPAVLACP